MPYFAIFVIMVIKSVISRHRARIPRCLENTSRPFLTDTHPNLSKHLCTKEIRRGGYDAETHP